MKQPFVRFIALLIIAITISISAHADNLFRKPQRRQKQYMTQEQIAAKQDSINNINAPIIEETSTEKHGNKHDAKPHVAKKDINSTQQIDSLLTMWRTINTTEYYERYFKDFLATAKSIDKQIADDNKDSMYIARLEALMSPVPLQYNYEVRAAIERFTSKYYAQVMSYAYYYFPMIEEELTKAGLPIELRAMAVIESSLNPTVTSRAGAKGLWQFMPRTGKEYGLEINSLVDERCNPLLATRAACKYLKNMYQAYGDWTLAIASYNCGPGSVNRAIIRSGGDPADYRGSFWDVYDELPTETRGYVPYFMGATYAFAYHKAHGIEYSKPPMPLAVDTIMIDRPMHLEQVSSTINIDLELLKMLNPQYTMSIIPATTKSYSLTLPADRISDYLINEEAIHAKDSTYLKEYVIHANLEKKRTEAPPAKYHTVKKGDTLGGIARKYGRTVNQLMKWNKLKNANSISIGQRIRVSA